MGETRHAEVNWSGDLQTGAGVIIGRMIQGAAGSTILACGLSLLSVANKGEARLSGPRMVGASRPPGDPEQ